MKTFEHGCIVGFRYGLFVGLLTGLIVAGCTAANGIRDAKQQELPFFEKAP